MHSPELRLRAVLFPAPSLVAALLLSLLVLVGCHGGPSIHTDVCADGHILSESPTPGNSGPVHPFNVPPQECDCGPAVAVIDVDGILLNMDMTGPGSAGENPVSLFRERLDAAAADPCTQAVVIRINSPGGGVTASDIMRHDLEQFKNRTHLPVVACLLDTAAGGAYYVATAADQIVANPTTVTGGIGVILNLYNIEDFLTKNDVHAATVKSGENIDIGTALHPATDDQRAQLEKMANDFHQRFREVVIRARPGMNPPPEEAFDGRIFTGSRAVELHLADSVGYLDDAVQAASGAAGVTGARVVLYHRCNDRARTPYSITPNVPMQGEMSPLNFPGLSRSHMPTFLYLWQPEPSMERVGGR
jgi:protease-4